MALHEITTELGNIRSARTIGDDLALLKKLGVVDSKGVGREAKWFLKS